MKYKWKYTKPTPEHVEAAKALGAKLGMSPVLASLLLHRGIKTESAAKRFFRPMLSDLIDPFLMNDMDVAVDRLNDAMGRKERIMVFGDYDVDGCTAVALVYRFLRQFYSNIEYYTPDRYEEGYGLSDKSLEIAKANDVKLVIMLDCGIKAVSEIARAKELGIDVIICDHHVPDDVMPPATAILNPKRPDSTYPFDHLSGCGVGFKLMQAFAANNGIAFSRLIPLLELCALSIAADIVPVVGENRILAYHGLRQLNTSPSVGVMAILESCSLTGREVTMSDIVFRIGPRINASGRMQNGTEAIALLVEKDVTQARSEASMLNTYNEQRKDVDKQTTEEANAIISSHLAELDKAASKRGQSSSLELPNGSGLDEVKDSDDTPQLAHRGVVLYDPNWTKGVVGIVASRIAEKYYRPTVVLTDSREMASGSARSIDGFDIYEAVKSCRDLLENFGGHTYAVGLTMRRENVPEFRRRFYEYVDSHLPDDLLDPALDIEEVIDFKDITKKFLTDLKRFAPHGPFNAKPLFNTSGVYDYGTSRVVGRRQEHIKLELVDSKSPVVLSGIAFGQSASARLIKSRHSFDIVYTIDENTFRRGEASLTIEDIKPTSE